MKPLLCVLLLLATAHESRFHLEKDDSGAVIAAAITNDDVSTQQLKQIAEIKTLQHLTLGYAPEGVVFENNALSVLAACRGLESLQLAKTALSDKELEFLAHLKSLTSLTIEGNDLVDVAAGDNPTNGLTDRFVESIEKLDSLEALVIRGFGDFSDDFIRRLSKLPKLNSLEVSSRRFTDQALIAIAANPRLTHLTIRSPQFTDTGIKALASLKTLQELEIGSRLLTKQSLHAIAPLTALKALDLPIKEVDREALAVVSQLKALQRLILRNAKLSDDEFQALKGHPSLQTLFLESSTLTRKSEAVLQSLNALKYGELGKDSTIQIPR